MSTRFLGSRIPGNNEADSQAGDGGPVEEQTVEDELENELTDGNEENVCC